MERERKQIPARVLFPLIMEQLAQNRQAAFTVTGMSMWPLLCHGRDQVTVESCIGEDLRTGDIILLQTPFGNYLLHRVTKITKKGVETTGDGNFFRDGTFPISCVRARVVCLTHRGNEIVCSGWKWRLASYLWMKLFPFRKPLFTVWFRIRKWFRPSGGDG